MDKRKTRRASAFLALAAVATAALCGDTPVPDTAAERQEQANPQARALELTMEIRSQADYIEGLLFNPKVTSEAIEALRKKSISYDLLLSREMGEADRKRLETERAAVNRELRDAVNAHPVAQAAAAELAADKAELAKLFQQIRAAEAENRNRAAAGN